MYMKKSKILSVRRSGDDTHYENVFDRHVNFKKRVIYLSDDIDEFSLELFLMAFDELERLGIDQPITIEISSYGGSIYDMLGMIDRMRSSKCHVITRGFGKIMSAATLILAAGDKDRRYVGKNSWFMIHEIADTIEGKMQEMENEMQHTKGLDKQAYKLYEQFSSTNTRARTFKKLCLKNYYIPAEKVLKLGLADHVIEDYK